MSVFKYNNSYSQLESTDKGTTIRWGPGFPVNNKTTIIIITTIINTTAATTTTTTTTKCMLEVR